jgi:hypothetical protein
MTARSAGQITVLTLIAAVILAICGSYGQRIFDRVLGLNRWCYRVLAHVALIKGQIPAVSARHRRHCPPRPPLPAPGRHRPIR